MKAVIVLGVLLANLPFAGPANAQYAPNLAGFDRAVSSFTGAAIGEPGGAAQPIDRRLHLAPCAAPPVIAWYGTGRDTVSVRCPDPGSWRIFVPLVQNGQATASQPAVLRGESVTIALEGEGFSVAQTGEALDPGVIGAWIRVRPANASSPPFRARIVRPGLVTVDLGGSTANYGQSGRDLP